MSTNAVEYFRLAHYQRHNQRRLEHLATLGLPIAGKSVLEVGAGVGDHTSFFLDRNCTVTSTDGRLDLVAFLRQRHPSVPSLQWDVEKDPPVSVQPHQIVYCYGLLYHVKNPDVVLARLASLATQMLLLETCVSFGNELAVNLVDEPAEDPTQALSGKGCRPTRPWVMAELGKSFPYVYVSKTQPWHEEFPIQWGGGLGSESSLSRSVFVASRTALSGVTLSAELLMTQTRC